ncbi:MAG: hypothetical protein KDI83_15475 [Gammaproteobacteria bacterium]|nr:hypothetical protein [Gammaproteobacteria bacterium]
MALITWQTLFRELLWAPLKRDEVEFLHSAWLMYGGARPFADFFQHHSPLYLQLVARFVDDPHELGWVIDLRLLSLFLLAASASMVGWLALAVVPKQWNFRSWLAALGTLLFLYLMQGLPVFEIRPESVAVPCFLAAWITHEIAIARRSFSLTIISGLLAGMAIALSPRALWPVAALMLTTLTAGLTARERYRFNHALVAGVTAIVSGLCVLFLLASGQELYQWLYRFSRFSRPLSPLFDTVSVTTLCWLLLPALPLFLLVSGRDPRLTLLQPMAVLLAALAGIALEPRQFGQSLSFVIPALTLFYSRALGHLCCRFRSQPQPSLYPVVIVVTTFSGMFAWHLSLLAASTSVPDAAISDIRLVAALRPEVDLLTSLHARTRFCERHDGERVLVEPTELHPICLADASYYWRGAEYLRAGTLQAAGIEHPKYEPFANVERVRPVLIGPAFRRGADVEERTAIERFLDDNYQPSGWAFLRKDIGVSKQP